MQHAAGALAVRGGPAVARGGARQCPASRTAARTKRGSPGEGRDTNVGECGTTTTYSRSQVNAEPQQHIKQYLLFLPGRCIVYRMDQENIAKTLENKQISESSIHCICVLNRKPYKTNEN